MGFELNGNYLFYDKDAITVKEVFRSNLLSQENALGKVKVTGFLRREWVAKSQKLWAEGNSIYLAGQGGDGTHHQTKYLREEDYLPIGIIIKLDGRDFRVDHVNFMFKSVSLQDMELTTFIQGSAVPEETPEDPNMNWAGILIGVVVVAALCVAGVFGFRWFREYRKRSGGYQ